MSDNTLTPEGILQIHASHPEQIFRLQPKVSNPTGYIQQLGIAEDSGIVGRPCKDHFMIYYEGNLNGACNLNTLEEKEQCAAGRLQTKYPTCAFTSLDSVEKVLELFDVSIYRPLATRGFQR